jgi:hypothetical protein
MTEDWQRERTRLLGLLDGAREEMRAVADLSLANEVVYRDSGWQVRDVIAHVAAWEDEAARSLEAFLEGESYHIPGFVSDDVYNRQNRDRWANADVAEVWVAWEAARARLKDALGRFDVAAAAGELVAPWGARGTVHMVIREMAQHEREHAADVRAALARPGDASGG